MNDDIRRRRVWRHMHTDYLQFAVEAVLRPRPVPPGQLDRNAIDAIRYSLDAIEATFAMVLSFGLTDQFGPLPDNWLTRHAVRQWKDASLEIRIGMLSYAWREENFWQHAEWRQLFLDLKKARDGLTHPVSFGTDEADRILEEYLLADGLRETVSEPTREPRLLRPQMLRGKGSIADFGSMPEDLSAIDAEKALEILLLHFRRVEEVFFRRESTQTGYYDPEADTVLTPAMLLKRIDRRFAGIWP